jgi:hypothetical protein
MEIQLTKREQLIERVLHMTDAEVTELLELIEDLRDGTEEEIRADEEQWDRQFDASADWLDRMADEALAEHDAGKTRPFPTP